jgi:hypothetical protein
VDMICGEDEVTEESKNSIIKIYDVWADAKDTEIYINKVQDRLNELKEKTLSLIPPGLHAAAQTNPSPTHLLKLLAQSLDPD